MKHPTSTLLVIEREKFTTGEYVEPQREKKIH
jgi:hypothetical protein